MSGSMRYSASMGLAGSPMADGGMIANVLWLLHSIARSARGAEDDLFDSLARREFKKVDATPRLKPIWARLFDLRGNRGLVPTGMPDFTTFQKTLNHYEWCIKIFRLDLEDIRATLPSEEVVTYAQMTSLDSKLSRAYARLCSSYADLASWMFEFEEVDSRLLPSPRKHTLVSNPSVSATAAGIEYYPLSSNETFADPKYSLLRPFKIAGDKALQAMEHASDSGESLTLQWAEMLHNEAARALGKLGPLFKEDSALLHFALSDDESVQDAHRALEDMLRHFKGGPKPQMFDIKNYDDLCWQIKTSAKAILDIARGQHPGRAPSVDSMTGKLRTALGGVGDYSPTRSTGMPFLPSRRVSVEWGEDPMLRLIRGYRLEGWMDPVKITTGSQVYKFLGKSLTIQEHKTHLVLKWADASTSLIHQVPKDMSEIAYTKPTHSGEEFDIAFTRSLPKLNTKEENEQFVEINRPGQTRVRFTAPSYRFVNATDCDSYRRLLNQGFKFNTVRVFAIELIKRGRSETFRGVYLLISDGDVKSAYPTLSVVSRDQKVGSWATNEAIWDLENPMSLGGDKVELSAAPREQVSRDENSSGSGRRAASLATSDDEDFTAGGSTGSSSSVLPLRFKHRAPARLSPRTESSGWRALIRFANPSYRARFLEICRDAVASASLRRSQAVDHDFMSAPSEQRTTLDRRDSATSFAGSPSLSPVMVPIRPSEPLSPVLVPILDSETSNTSSPHISRSSIDRSREFPGWQTGPIASSEASTMYHLSLPPPIITTLSSQDDALISSEQHFTATSTRGVKSIRCPEPGCNADFQHLSDLEEHERIHSRPWKCQEIHCKYHEIGWSTEKELSHHVSSEHKEMSEPNFKQGSSSQVRASGLNRAALAGVALTPLTGGISLIPSAAATSFYNLGRSQVALSERKGGVLGSPRQVRASSSTTSLASIPERSRSDSELVEGQRDVEYHQQDGPESASSAKKTDSPLASTPETQQDPLSRFDEQAATGESLRSRLDSPSLPQERAFDQLSDDLKLDLELTCFTTVGDCWTCTPSDTISQDEVPLTVDGKPVVIPVRSIYPLTSMTSPPPDPHPHFIDPTRSVSDSLAAEIFKTFTEAAGFYLLINGWLQLIVPDQFHHKKALSELPGEFGGLKVSFIPQEVIPTAGPSSAPTTRIEPPSLTSTSSPSRPFWRRPATEGSSSGQTPATMAASSPLIKAGGTVRAATGKDKTKARFEGKTGVLVGRADGSLGAYMTVPTHLFTDAILASKVSKLPSSTWTKDVRLVEAKSSAELGPIARVFDLQPQEFPLGFESDVTLVDVSQHVKPGLTNQSHEGRLGWLGSEEWMGIKYNATKLRLMDERSREAKSIGIVDSHCQVVGQAIFRTQQESKTRSLLSRMMREPDPLDNREVWTSLVARSILYRVHPDFSVRGGQSGTPLCLVSKDEKGAEVLKVVGFASFVQMASDVQKYDMEGDKLYKRLQEGRVAFYGAFQVPRELREEYLII